MRKILLLSVMCICLATQAQQSPILTIGTAHTTPWKQFETGGFLPLRYGLTPTFELQLHPIWFLVHPNLNVKKKWGTIPWWGGMSIASQHGFYIPTLSLQLLQNRDWFPDDLPSGTSIPLIIGFRNDLYLSKTLMPRTSCNFANHILTFKIGSKIAYRNDSIRFVNDTVPLRPFNYPVLYQETSIFHRDVLWYLGADWDGWISETLAFSMDIEFQGINLLSDWDVFHKGMLIFWFSRNIYGITGYKLMYGSYPTGNRFSILPYFDIGARWRFKKNIKEQRGLFDPDMIK